MKMKTGTMFSLGALKAEGFGSLSASSVTVMKMMTASGHLLSPRRSTSTCGLSYSWTYFGGYGRPGMGKSSEVKCSIAMLFLLEFVMI
jgi:hypothetical protein